MFNRSSQYLSGFNFFNEQMSTVEEKAVERQKINGDGDGQKVTDIKRGRGSRERKGVRNILADMMDDSHNNHNTQC